MKYTIFILDDEPDIVELLRVNLEKNGYTTRGFYDGESLLQHIRNGKNTPDLFILDIMLPGIDGIEVAKEIRQNRNTSNTPIIFLSARNEDIDRIMGLEIGGDDYITKPFNIRELLARVKAVLRRSRGEEKTSEVISI